MTLGWRMTGDKFRARADEYIKAAHSIADPVRKLAVMDIAQRWLGLAAQIDATKERPQDPRNRPPRQVAAASPAASSRQSGPRRLSRAPTNGVASSYNAA